MNRDQQVYRKKEDKLGNRRMKGIVFHWALYFLVISQLITIDFVNAQEEQRQVEVSVYLTEEKKACTPDGYAAPCDPLIYEKLDSYEFGEPIYARVPPECLPLGELAERIKEATEDCPIEKYCKDPVLRKAIVLVFYFHLDHPKGRKVEFIREIPPRLEKYFELDQLKGIYVAEGTLDHGGHWINHQRADLFLPDYGVRWILDVDSDIYRIGTRKGFQVKETGEWKCDE